MVAVVRTNTAEAGAKRRFLSVGTFEHAQTDSGWEFRPNEGSARRLATLHAGCLTLLAIVVLEASRENLTGAGAAGIDQADDGDVGMAAESIVRLAALTVGRLVLADHRVFFADSGLDGHDQAVVNE